MIGELEKVSSSAGNASAAMSGVSASASGASAAGASAMAGLAAAVGPVIAVLGILKQKFNENKEFLQSDRSLWTDTSWSKAGEGLTNLGAALMTVNPKLKAGVYALRSFIQPGQELLGVLGNLAQNGFQKAGDAFKSFAASSFEKAGGAVKSFVGNIGNGLKSVDWPGVLGELGGAIAEGFNAAIDTLWEIVSDKNFWAKLGKGIERGINEFLMDVHIGTATENLIKAITEGIKLAIRAVSVLVSNNIFWSDLQNGIVNGINSFFENINPNDLVDSLVGLLKRIIQTAVKTISALASNASWWEELGTAIGNGINDIFANTDWISLLQGLTTLATSILTGLSNALRVINWDEAWNEIKRALDAVDWGPLIEAAMGFFAESFKAKLKLKLFEGGTFFEIGKKIIGEIGEALLSGAALFIESVATIFSDVGQIISAAMTGRWAEIPGLVGKLTNDVHSIVDKWGQKIHGTTEAHMQETEKSISSHFEAGNTSANALLGQMQAGVSQKLQLMQSDTDTKMSLISSGITAGFETAKNNSTPVVEALGAKVASGFEAMRAVVQNKTENIASTSKANWNSTKTDTVSNLESMSSSTSTQYGNIKNTVASNLSETETTSNSKWAAMQAAAKAKMVAMHTETVLQYAAMKKAVTTSLEETKTASAAILGQMKEALASATNDTVEAIRVNFGKTASAVMDGLSAAKSAALTVDWQPIGRQIIDGVAYGVRQQAARLANEVRSSILQAAQAAREAAQIHSPSRLFRDAVGVYLGEGIAAGVDKSQGAVIASMYTMTDKLHNAFTSAMIASEDAFAFPVHEDFSASYTAEFESNGQEGDTAAEFERGMRSANGEVVSTLYAIAGQLVEAVNAVAQRPIVTEIDGKTLMQTVESQQRQRGVDIMGGGVLV